MSRLEDEGAQLLVDGTGIKKGELVIIAVEEYAKKNPRIIEKLLQIYKRGNDFIKANPKQAAELIASEVKLTPEQLAKVLAKIDFDPVIRPEHIDELKKTEEFLRNNELTKNPVDIDKFVDVQYLKSAGLK